MVTYEFNDDSVGRYVGRRKFLRQVDRLHCIDFNLVLNKDVTPETARLRTLASLSTHRSAHTFRIILVLSRINVDV